MKKRLIELIKTYFLFVGIFALQKPLFMWYYHSLYADVSWKEWLATVWHGLPLDLSMAGYLTALPGLLLIASVWTLSETLRRIKCGYFLLVSVSLSVMFVADMALYGYWGFRLDATPLFYFASSPKESLASVSTGFIALGIGAMIGYALLLYSLFWATLLRKRVFLSLKLPYRRMSVSLTLLLLTGLLFIPIRGGFSVSTMNTGKVYFSTNLRLNHAATNPVFNLMESLSKQKDFTRQYRFMGADEAERIFATLLDPSVPGAVSGTAVRMRADTLATDSLASDSLQALKAASRTLFNTSRPDICFIILEGFSSCLMKTLGGEPDVAVHLDSLAQEGVLFTRFYANSFRTDRGLVSILSGYPAQPTTSIMKYPRKTQNLPSIARSLREVGYEAHYYYGGDADFTNMRSYLRSSGFETIVSDQDFPVSERLSKWGAHDHLVFQRLLNDLQEESRQQTKTQGNPQFRVLQTSSSHEPFEVPYRRLANDRLNSFAYTDSCLGDFIRRFRELPQWHNTVVVFVPDHLGGYPENISNFDLKRYHIPLLMTGGAVCAPRRIDVYGSQQDIAATLLTQLGLPHDTFTFSKDMLNPDAPHFAFFTVPDAFGLASTDNQLIYDNLSSRIVLDEGEQKGKNLPLGEAYLQKLYDDLAKR